MATQITVPSSESDALWLAAYQEILFGVNDGGYMYAWSYTGVTDVDGKAQFTMSGLNPYDTPPCKLMKVLGGVYEGIHVIKKIQDNGDILTDTDYISDETGTDARLLVNIEFKIYYGYPTQGSTITVRPVWNASDATMIVDLRKYLQSIFTIVAPPTIGLDTDMFTHFRVRVVPSQDLIEYLDGFAVDAQDVVDTLTDWEYDNDSDPDDPHKWYLLNATAAHSVINGLAAPAEVLSIDTPITFTGKKSIVSKIMGDVVHNLLIEP